MAGKIFISYRREDDPAAAARVRDALASKFGKANLFMDVDSLVAGQRFDDELRRALAVCDVLIAIIGPRWMDLLESKRVMSGPRDYVREEIAQALKRNVVVVPVRVGREGGLPPLPRAKDLPADIRDLVEYQKHDVVHERFSRDMAQLIEAIHYVRRSRRTGHTFHRAPLAWISAGAATVLALSLLVYVLLVSGLWAPHASQRTDRVSMDKSQAALVPARCDGVETQVGSERRCLKAKDSFRDCSNCPEMVVVPAGTFTMGSPVNEPERFDREMQVRVSIGGPFAAGKYAVTFDEWDACVADGGCNIYKPNDQGWGRGKHPVINVSWDDAKAYTTWLSRKTGMTYRLLSEAEREYVTRADTTMPFWWGSSITPMQANFDGSVDPYRGGGSKGEYRQRTVPVHSFEPNPWGLYNVHGNVWEWTEDCWNDSNTGNPGDGRPRTTGDCSRRVIRGGSWDVDPQLLRSASRLRYPSGVRDISRGFRLARTL
jgi:formylglycine-generating enzyme required for sulfatase activity